MEDDDIILLLLMASGATNLSTVLYQNQDGSWCGLNHGYNTSAKSVYRNIIWKLKPQDHYDYRKYF